MLLRHGLAREGIAVGAVANATLEVNEGDHHLFVLCERVEERWLLSINSPAGGLVNLGLNFDTPFMRKVIGRLHATLTTTSTVERVAWHFTKDWDAGRWSLGTETPELPQ